MPAYTKKNQTGRQWVEVDGLSKWQGNESDLQNLCEGYLLHFPQIAIIRIPDVVYEAIFSNSNLPVWIKKLVSKYLKGLPDLVLLKQDGLTTKALCIELKTEKGKQSQGQKKFGNIVRVHIVRSFEVFIKLIDEFNR